MTSDFALWHGRLNAIGIATIAGCTVLGSVMVRWWPMWTPIALSGLLAIPALLLATTLTEPPRDDVRRTYLHTGRDALIAVARCPALLAVMPLMTINNLALLLVAALQQPFLLSAGVPPWAVGFFVAGQLLLGAVGSWVSALVGRWIGIRGAFLLTPVIGGAALAAAAPGVVWLYPVFILSMFGWNVMWPLFTDYLSRRVTDSLRATTLSIASVITSVITVVAMPMIGVAIDAIGFTPTVLATAAVLSASAAMLYLAWLRAGGPTLPVLDASETPAVPSIDATTATTQ